MRHSIKIGPDYVRAQMVGRTSAKQTRRFVDGQVAALRESGLRRLLVSVRASRPLFKVQEWDFLAVLDEMAGMKGLKVALVSDTKELAMTHEYAALLARQRRVAFRAFRNEREAVAWLLGTA